jgi:hypothetical protein
MVTYVVNYTDTTKIPLNVGERKIDQSLPIAIFGRRQLSYGELMNENLLHLLENFSCPDVTPNDPSGLPQLDPDAADGGALAKTLTNATTGQLWYNSTNNIMYRKTNNNEPGNGDQGWVPMGDISDVTSISGSVKDGEVLPLPISNSGHEYTEEECYWIVSPRVYSDEISEMVCKVDDNTRVVTMSYNTIAGTQYDAANYMVIGIKE